MKTAQNIRTAALNNAQIIRKFDRSLSWATCMILGWAKAKVMAAIASVNGATVTYNTDGGNTVQRDATALNSYTPTTNGARKSSPLAVVYFDKTADGIRSFRIDRLVKVA